MLAARDRPDAIVFAPIAGLAIASAVLTTFAVVMPMRIAAYAVLVPMALISSGFVLWHRFARAGEEISEARAR